MREQIKVVIAVALFGAAVWFVYTQFSGGSFLPVGSPTPPPEPNLGRLDELKGVASVSAAGVLGGKLGYDLSGRNLFQYGTHRPPPPTPAELEAMRQAEAARLAAMEEEARRRAEEQQKAQQQAEAAARAAADQLAQQQQQQQNRPPAPPSQPVAQPAPPINLKLIGYLGPQERRIAVFLNGKDIVLGRQGEVLEGKFKLLSIGTESVEMGYVDPAHADHRKRIELGS